MSKCFNRQMSIETTLTMNKVLKNYKGFEGVSQVVDVGGGVGTNLKLIVSKHPKIRGINFDLPQVIKDASILHDWGDDQCLKLLKVCHDALPKNGKIPGAKERTKQEFEALVKQAGFSSLKIVCRAYCHWVMEIC
ncbi:hypothetical protein Gogos_010931, partial [Gossypium gossypioides]|nr:hypothetical protein [Gossypium gossypioides]